jgi:hypothetical protein
VAPGTFGFALRSNQQKWNLIQLEFTIFNTAGTWIVGEEFLLAVKRRGVVVGPHPIWRVTIEFPKLAYRE